MITENKQDDTMDKWHYIAVKSISGLFRGITWNNNGDFYCLSCLHSFRTDNALKKHERLCNNHDYFKIDMPKEDKNILRYNHGEKSLKVAHAFYLDTESLLVKQQSSQNNPEESFAERKAIHEACGYSLNLVTSCDSNKSTHSFYRGTDWIKKLCKDVKTQAMEIINLGKKEMIPLTYDEKVYYEE